MLGFHLQLYPSRACASGAGRAQQLRAEDRVVELALAKELFVGAAGGDLAVVQNQDQIRITYGACSLGYDEHSVVALAHQLVERLLDGSLGLSVDGGGAVVKDQESGIYE